MRRILLPGLLICAAVGCRPSGLQDIGPPHAFHVRILHQGGVADLDVFVSAESGAYFEPDVNPDWSAGHWVRTDIYWGGAEPDGSIGICRASIWNQELEFELVAEKGEDGRPITQHASTSVGWHRIVAGW